MRSERPPVRRETGLLDGQVIEIVVVVTPLSGFVIVMVTGPVAAAFVTLTLIVIDVALSTTADPTVETPGAFTLTLAPAWKSAPARLTCVATLPLAGLAREFGVTLVTDGKA